MTQLLDESRAELYADFHSTMLLESPTWVHRRVDKVRFVDDETVRISVSIDFDLDDCSVGDLYRQFLNADELPVFLLPIGLFEKRNLEDFDLKGEDGKSLSLLTKDENTAISAALLLQHARYVVGDDRAGLVKEQLAHLVASTADEAVGRLASFGHDGDHYPASLVAQELLLNPGFEYLLNALTRKFLAVAVLSEPPEARTIIKYAYTSSLVWKWRQVPLAGRLALQPARLNLDVVGVTAASSYHLDIEAPEQLELRKASIWKLDQEHVEAARRSMRSYIWRPKARPPYQKILVAQVRGKLPRAHLAVHRKTFADNRRYQLEVQLAPQRRGFVRGAVVAAFFSVTAVLLVALFHARIADRINQSAVGILLVVPGLLAAQLSRPSEHPIASRLYIGLRLALATSAACTWAAASAIALDVSRVVLNRLAYGLLSVATLTLLLTLAAYVAATGNPDPVYRQEGS